jgi:uncharacterized protein (DUF58 family)
MASKLNSSAPHEFSGDGVYTSIEELVSLNALARHLSHLKARVVSQAQSGSHHSRFKGRGMEFAEVRPYQAGDDVRSIDWRVTARRQSPHTKLFQEERERPVMILCDQSASMFFGSQHCMKSVLAARSAALLAWSGLSHNDRIGGIVFNDELKHTVKPARSRKALLRFFKHIEDANRALNADLLIENTFQNNNFFAEALIEANQVTRPGTLVFVISDFHRMDSKASQQLSALARHNELILLRCSDPLEHRLPSGGVLPIRNGEDVLYLSPDENQTRSALRAWDDKIERQLAELAKSRNINVWDISTDLPVDSQLHQITNQVRGVGRR